MTKDEALTLALEALEGADQIDVDMQDAITAIKEALAQPVLNPAPGYCKNCKDYTIEEPLLAQPVQEPDYCGPSSTIYGLVEMVMSDCGHSSNNQSLLNRIADRIQQHIDTAAPPLPVQPAAQAEPSKDAETSALGWPMSGLLGNMSELRERWADMKTLGYTGAGEREVDRFWSPLALTTIARYFEEIDKALATPTKPAAQAEPVARKTLCELCIKRGYNFCANVAKTTPLPTPPAAQAEPLTDEQIEAIGHRKASTYTHRSDPTSHAYGFVKHTLIDFARAIEATHNIGGAKP